MLSTAEVMSSTASLPGWGRPSLLATSVGVVGLSEADSTLGESNEKAEWTVREANLL
jgi:hypothetical protein